jgi:hypothetical protein
VGGGNSGRRDGENHQRAGYFARLRPNTREIHAMRRRAESSPEIDQARTSSYARKRETTGVTGTLYSTSDQQPRIFGSRRRPATSRVSTFRPTPSFVNAYIRNNEDDAVSTTSTRAEAYPQSGPCTMFSKQDR